MVLAVTITSYVPIVYAQPTCSDNALKSVLSEAMQ
jgi:hypothetical protein